jgi:uncharacterized Zn finger protein (UPF0148 family)
MFGFECQDCGLRFWWPDGTRWCPRCESPRTVAFGDWPAELHEPMRDHGRVWCAIHLDWEAA